MKKVLGFILLSAACFFALAVIVGLVQGVFLGALSQDSGAEAIGYVIGSLIGVIIIGALAFICFKFGMKLLKNKPLDKPGKNFERP